jgi:type 2 lantibiotic biosynthesis protein LanM
MANNAIDYTTIQNGLEKLFLVDIMNEYCDYPLVCEKNVFYDYLFNSGIVEEYDKIIEGFLPVLYSGIAKSNVGIDNDTVLRAKRFIEENYPIYVQKKRRIITRGFNNIERILSLLKKDSGLICSVYAIDNPERPCQIELGAGDYHRGGKGVTIIQYSKDKLVYKPRNLSLDKHFYQILSRLGKLCGYSFYCPKIVLSGNYGWEEYIDYEECHSIDEVRGYYSRLGFLLCVLYSLEGTDIHYENIICKGQFPVIIDLEAICCPYNPIDGAEANQGLYQSILRCGIIPSELSLDGAETDISGMADVDSVKSPFSFDYYDVDSLGNVYKKEEYGQIKKGKNVPILRNHTVYYSDYAKDFIRGFSSAYRCILNNREEYLSLINTVDGDEVRVLFRNTVAYSYILQQTNMLRCLQDSLVYKKLIVSSLTSTIKEYKVLQRIVPYEIEDVIDGDIPYFSTYTNSLSLWHNDSTDEELESFFDDTGIETIRRKIKRFSNDDLENQLWIIKTILSKEQYLNSCTIRASSGLTFNMRRDLGLRTIADEAYCFIKDSLHITRQYAHGLMLQPISIDSTTYRFFEASYDLFYGISGVILFLTAYGILFDCDEALHIANKAYKYLGSHINICKQSIKTTGLYTGWGAVILLNNRLFEMLGDESYLINNKRILSSINLSNLIDRDNYYGLIKGNAGLIVALCDYYRICGDNEVKKHALYAGNKLLSKSIEINNGIGWRVSSKQPLSGLSHGASGFALAFLRLYLTIDKSYGEVVEKIIEYEDSLFLEERNNWVDVRDYIIKTKGNGFCSTAWAHGAGGIGLLRLELLKNGIDITRSKKRLDSAIATTIKYGFTDNLDLSYGSFGNIELLHEASQSFSDPELCTWYDNAISSILKKYANGDYTLGAPFKTIGMMTGFTGIAYESLRLLSPKKVKTILLP